MQTVKTLSLLLWDGGEKHNFKAKFSAENVTEEELKAKFQNCIVLKETEFIFDSIEEYEKNSAENVKKNALAKLTEYEKSVLGIKE